MPPYFSQDHQKNLYTTTLYSQDVYINEPFELDYFVFLFVLFFLPFLGAQVVPLLKVDVVIFNTTKSGIKIKVIETGERASGLPSIRKRDQLFFNTSLAHIDHSDGGVGGQNGPKV